ncbi:MAG: hypothetical protein U9R01_05205 [candidate division WOR-3 bacterium]|nr:hypothetical protein [candidate division WOR-3 bacterium]
MTNLQEMEKALIAAYEKRYGKQVDMGLPRLQYNGRIPNKVNVDGSVIDYTPYYHWQIWWLDDDGAVKEKPIYAYSTDEIHFEWHDRNPTILPSKPSTAKQSFGQELQDALKTLITEGTIDYYEILAVNEEIQRARVFIKDSTTEALYIVSLDADGNLIRKETTYSFNTSLKSGV